MKTYLIGAALAALVAVPALALQNASPVGHGPVAPQTRTELQTRLQERFGKLDANKDGAVTQAEFDAHHTAMKAERVARRAERREERFAALDTDKNGQLSKAEFAAEQPRGDRMGGHHGRRFHRGMAEGMRGKGMLAAADANKDGKLTFAEMSARPLAMFDQVDKDKNGSISAEERQAAREAMRAAWKAKRAS